MKNQPDFIFPSKREHKIFAVKIIKNTTINKKLNSFLIKQLKIPNQPRSTKLIMTTSTSEIKCIEKQSIYHMENIINAKTTMDRLHELQDQIPDYKVVLAKLSHEQLKDLHSGFIYGKVLCENGRLHPSFEQYSPRQYHFLDIDGKLRTQEHPLLGYLRELLNDSELKKKHFDKQTKKTWISHIDMGLRGFMFIADENPLDPLDCVDDEDTILMSTFEAHLRRLAMEFFIELRRIMEEQSGKKDIILQKRKEVYNITRRIKRAERNVARETEKMRVLMEEKEKSEAELEELGN